MDKEGETQQSDAYDQNLKHKRTKTVPQKKKAKTFLHIDLLQESIETSLGSQ